MGCTKSKSAYPKIEKDISRFEKNYIKGQKLGEGAFSEVFEVTKKNTGVRYAVKITARKELTQVDEDAIHNEYYLLKKLNHKHVVKFIEFYENPQFFYTILELIEGGKLFDRICEKEKFNELMAKEFAHILLSTLSYLHDHDIVHRDLKPENLLMASKTNDTDIKIADFGFAKETAGATLQSKCGSPSYISPEILLGIPYGKSTDMWAAGVIIFILLGGYPPFASRCQNRLFTKIVEADFRFDPEFWDAVSADAKDLISKLLTVDTEKRLTAKQALQHPWFQATRDSLSVRDLGKNLEAFKRYRKNARFRAAANAIIATNKFTKSLHFIRVDQSFILDENGIDLTLYDGEDAKDSGSDRGAGEGKPCGTGPSVAIAAAAADTVTAVVAPSDQ